ncbi:hypothetical protein VMCG_05593 [Cytospora schulzeri]|uniref:MYND-type zinc finger protein samB n=1 Tax=Cytospora schulzeri TaxID=448051 RepID=A0A423WEV0_9PEZI|nr:hypothetical protein VMCG_05593 [Valsa malicola]
MPPYANLLDETSFPPWEKLPWDTSCPELGILPWLIVESYKGCLSDTHWCFLAEIQECNGIKFFRYRTVVKDDKDKVMFVSFYPDSYEGFDWKKLKKGHTLAIMYAMQHRFLDGTSGVRVEDMDDVHVFPISLRDFKGLGTEMKKYLAETEGGRWKCHGCDESKPSHQMSRCGKCKLDCQAKGWNERDHKQHCKVIRDPNFMALMKLDFSEYEGPFSFQRT